MAYFISWKSLTTPQSVEKYFDKYSIDESQEVNSQEVKIEKVLTI